MNFTCKFNKINKYILYKKYIRRNKINIAKILKAQVQHSTLGKPTNVMVDPLLTFYNCQYLMLKFL